MQVAGRMNYNYIPREDIWFKHDGIASLIDDARFDL